MATLSKIPFFILSQVSKPLRNQTQWFSRKEDFGSDERQHAAEHTIGIHLASYFLSPLLFWQILQVMV